MVPCLDCIDEQILLFSIIQHFKMCRKAKKQGSQVQWCIQYQYSSLTAQFSSVSASNKDSFDMLDLACVPFPISHTDFKNKRIVSKYYDPSQAEQERLYLICQNTYKANEK